jgi:hypothetical protein
MHSVLNQLLLYCLLLLLLSVPPLGTSKRHWICSQYNKACILQLSKLSLSRLSMCTGTYGNDAAVVNLCYNICLYT